MCPHWLGSFTEKMSDKLRSTIAVFLLVAGLAALTTPQCSLKVDQDAVLTLTPSSENCQQSSVTVHDVWRGYCKNDGANCASSHVRHSSRLYFRCCVADGSSARTEVTDTTTVSDNNGCSKQITYRFVNITACACKRLESISGVTGST